MTDIKTLATELKSAAQNPHHFGDTGMSGHRKYCMVECEKLERLADAVLNGPVWCNSPTCNGLWAIAHSSSGDFAWDISDVRGISDATVKEICGYWFGPIPARGDGE